MHRKAQASVMPFKIMAKHSTKASQRFIEI